MALLKNKIAIITGASGGIGSTIAETLAKEGCNLVLADCAFKKISVVLKKINQYNVQSLALVIDVSNKRRVKELVEKTIKRFSKIDILINAAGIYGPIGSFVNNDIDQWLRAIKINLIGSALCTKAVLPFMIKQGKGKIVNFSGGGAVNPFPNFSSYATSKAAVVRFTETLAEELKPHNIQLNAIAPGAVNTTFLDEALKAGPGSTGKDFYAKIKKQKASGGDSPQLAADLVLFLVSGRSYKLSGKLISAKWDSWRIWNKKQINKIMQTSDYTLRRIDNKNFKATKT